MWPYRNVRIQIPYSFLPWHTAPNEWLHPADALEQLTDPEIRADFDKVKAEHDAILQEVKSIDREISKLRREARGRPIDPETPVPNHPTLTVGERDWVVDHLTMGKLDSSELQVQRFRMLADLYGKLQNGSLVAKGFAEPIKAENDEIMIPKAQWRLVRLDGWPLASTLGEEATGHGITYKSVRIKRR